MPLHHRTLAGFAVVITTACCAPLHAQSATVFQIDPETSHIGITATVAGFSETAWTTPTGSFTLDLLPASNPTSASLRALRIDHGSMWYYAIPFPPFGTLPFTLSPLSVSAEGSGVPTPAAPISAESREFLLPGFGVRFTGNASYATSGPICPFRLSGIAPCELATSLHEQGVPVSLPTSGHIESDTTSGVRVRLTFSASVPLDAANPAGGSISVLATIEGTSGGTPPCRADFNGTGGVTVQDLFDFLTAWFSNSPAADVNASGSITAQDLFDFLSLWFTGC